jgi:hypothetical protein
MPKRVPLVEVPARITTVLRDQFDLDATTALIGRTVYASIDVPGMFERITPDLEFDLKDSMQMGDLLGVAMQVGLGTEPTAEFYILRVLDSALGGEMRFIVYLDDIRRVYTGALTLTEFFGRRLNEIKRDSTQELVSDVWLDREPLLGEFLALQMGLRIKTLAYAEDSPTQAWGVVDASGWYHDGVIVLLVARELEQRTNTDDWPEEILTLAARILHEYEFVDHTAVVLQDITTQSTITLTPAELQAHLAYPH